MVGTSPPSLGPKAPLFMRLAKVVCRLCDAILNFTFLHLAVNQNVKTRGSGLIARGKQSEYLISIIRVG